MKTISILETAPGVWHVTLDGAVAEGSRGRSRKMARAEACAIMETEEHACIREGRLPRLRLADEILLPFADGDARPAARATTEFTADTDGTSVWVNSTAGWCMGRFGRAGAEVFSSPEEARDRPTRLLMAEPGSGSREDWDRFRAALGEHHGIDLDDGLIPVHDAGMRP